MRSRWRQLTGGRGNTKGVFVYEMTDEIFVSYNYRDWEGETIGSIRNSEEKVAKTNECLDIVPSIVKIKWKTKMKLITPVGYFNCLPRYKWTRNVENKSKSYL